jgi:acyl-homoserine lactone acylase PvdQ
MDRDSAGALAFYAFLNFLARRALGDDMAFFFGPVLEAKPIYLLRIAVLVVTGGMPDAGVLLQGGRNLTVLNALDDTAAFLTDRFGGVEAERYAWADFHGSRFENVWGERLDGGWTPSDGSDDTVNQASAPFFVSGAVVERLESDNGVIFRQVTSFDEDGRPRMELGFPRGNSGDPDSVHWDDRLADWVEGRNRPLPFGRDEVEADAVEELILAP